MLLLYIILIVYILAVNFYAFLYMRSLNKAEKSQAVSSHAEKDLSATEYAPEKPSQKESSDYREPITEEDLQNPSDNPTHDYAKNISQPKIEEKQAPPKDAQKEKKKTIQALFDWRLLLAGVMGGAITIYACMFIYKYKLNNLFLMVLMPVLGAVNVYLWIVLFQSGFFMRI